MERLTYFDGGKWRLKIGDTEYSGKAVDRLASYEATGLEPEEVVALRDRAERAEKERDSAVKELEDHAEDMCSNCLHSPYERNKWPSGTHKITCSECGEWNGKQSNYCPNCGCDMREVDHD